MQDRLKQPIGQQARSTGAEHTRRAATRERQASGTETQSTCSGARSRRHAQQARSAGSSKHQCITIMIMNVPCFVANFVAKTALPYV